MLVRFYISLRHMIREEGISEYHLSILKRSIRKLKYRMHEIMITSLTTRTRL